MASTNDTLTFQRDFDPKTGENVSIAPGIARITAPNSSAYTFTGTNSFLLGNEQLFIVDPGPDDDRHLRAIVESVNDRNVLAVILTHTHKDHAALAEKLAITLDAPIWFGGQHRLSRPKKWFEINPIANSSDWELVPDRVLADGDRLTVGDMEIEVIATPGHCANHLSFGIVGTDYILSGDHVMGWSSTLISVPDGSMADYFAALDRIIATRYQHYLPAHGGPIPDGRAYASALRKHREYRNAQIVDALQDGPKTSMQILHKIYEILAPNLVPAAHMTLIAHLEYLQGLGTISLRRTLWGYRARLTDPH